METSDYYSDLTEPLGSGSYSSVYLGHSKKDSNIKVAVKEIKNDSKIQGKFSESAKKEYFSMKKACNNVNIMQLLDFHATARFIYIIMEFCDLGDLEQYAKNRPLLSEQKLDIMTQCANGVTYLHNMEPPIIHRDLKPQNILMTQTAQGDIVKISDFGLSKVLEDDSKQYMSTDAGTPKFRAPELFKQGRLQYTSAVDVFALGLVYLVLLKFDRGRNPTFEPYDKPDEPYLVYGLRLLLCRKNRQPFPTLFELVLTSGDDNLLEIEIKTLICKMVMFESENRPLMKAVLKDLKIIVEKCQGQLPRANSEYEAEVRRLSKDFQAETEKNQLIIHRKQKEINQLQQTIESLKRENQHLKKSADIEIKNLEDSMKTALDTLDQKDRKIQELEQKLTNMDKSLKESTSLEQADIRSSSQTTTKQTPGGQSAQQTEISHNLQETSIRSNEKHTKGTSSTESMSLFTKVKGQTKDATSVSAVEYNELARNTYKVEKSINMSTSSRTIKINHNKLLCTTPDSLLVYSVDGGDLLSTVKFNYGGEYAHSTVAVNSHQFIVADRRKGVFLLNKDGDCIKQLCKGQFSDLHQYQGKVYGLEYKQGQVVVFELQRQTWSKSHTITLKGYTYGTNGDRLCVNNNNIYTSSWFNHCLQTYNMDGVLLSTYGKKGLDPRGVKAGLLWYPFLCDVDNSGTALIADCWNHRLQTCTATGEWQVITLPHTVEEPTYAVVNNEDQSIWVVSHWKTLHKLKKK